MLNLKIRNLPAAPCATAKALAARGREASAKQGRQAGLEISNLLLGIGVITTTPCTPWLQGVFCFGATREA
jgi:hypothetical protein